MKLITWNTQWCKGIDGVVDVPRIIDGAKSLGEFDVLCLQEIAINYPHLTGDRGSDQVAIIEALLPDYEVVFGAAIDERPGGVRQQFGTLIASRLPILQVQKIALPAPCPAVPERAWMPRICTVATVAAEWGPVHVMTTHLEYSNVTQRQAQANALRDWHQLMCQQARHVAPLSPTEDQTPYQAKPHTLDAILCGDFNFETDSEAYHALTNANEADPFSDGWLLANPNKPHPPTFRLYDDAYGPDAVSCDFCFVSETLKNRVEKVEVDTLTKASDHQPVMITLRH